MVIIHLCILLLFAPAMLMKVVCRDDAVKEVIKNQESVLKTKESV